MVPGLAASLVGWASRQGGLTGKIGRGISSIFNIDSIEN